MEMHRLDLPKRFAKACEFVQVLVKFSMGSESSDNADLDIPSREYLPLALRRLHVDLTWGLCYMRIGLDGEHRQGIRDQVFRQ